MNLNIKLRSKNGKEKTLILNTNMTIAEAKEKAGEKIEYRNLVEMF